MDVLLGWLDPAWMVEQFMVGNGIPFVLWTAVVFVAGYSVGRKWKARADGEEIAGENEALRAEVERLSAELRKVDEKRPEDYSTPSVELVGRMPPSLCGSIYRAHQSGDYVKFADVDEAMIVSVKNSDGVFELTKRENPFGQLLEARSLNLCRPWVVWLSSADNLAAVESAAGSWKYRTV